MITNMKNVQYRNIGEKVVILHCTKELSFTEASDFAEGLRMLMRSFPNIILDLTHLEYIDSSIIGVIRRMAKKPESNIYVVTPPNAVAGMVIRVVNLSKIVQTYDSMKEVLSKLGVEDEADTCSGEWSGENFQVQCKEGKTGQGNELSGSGKPDGQEGKGSGGSGVK